jgi:N-formylglutamate amidohydrolase
MTAVMFSSRFHAMHIEIASSTFLEPATIAPQRLAAREVVDITAVSHRLMIERERR